MLFIVYEKSCVCYLVWLNLEVDGFNVFSQLSLGLESLLALTARKLLMKSRQVVC